MRRTMPAAYEPMDIVEDMNRQMARAMHQVQELFDDMERVEDWASRFDDGRYRRREPQALVKRTESGGLQLALDMSDFKPEDLKIKLVDDNLVVEADSESSGKDSYSKSHFKRWFKLPEDVKANEIKSRLTEGNKLVIDLPLNKPIESSERTIPIEVQTDKRQALGDNSGQSDNKQDEHQDRQDERMAASR